SRGEGLTEWPSTIAPPPLRGRGGGGATHRSPKAGTRVTRDGHRYLLRAGESHLSSRARSGGAGAGSGESRGARAGVHGAAGSIGLRQEHAALSPRRVLAGGKRADQ